MTGSVWITANASGAYAAARQGYVVLIVDVIDMSTTLESVLDAGAAGVFGASPGQVRVPVPLDPYRIGMDVGRMARRQNIRVLLISEPRVGDYQERLDRCAMVVAGMAAAGVEPEAILPNLGVETVKLADFTEKLVVAVTDTGGVAFDAAYNAGGIVTIGTVARTWRQKGIKPAVTAAHRVMQLANAQQKGIAVVAASANSWEDILAAQCIANIIYQEGFANRKF